MQRSASTFIDVATKVGAGVLESRSLQGLNLKQFTNLRCFTGSKSTLSDPAPSIGEAGDNTSPEEVYTLLPDRIEGPYTVAPKKVFAVVELGGSQHKVTPDDLLVTEKLIGVDIHDRLRLGRVLLLGSESETIIGRPYIPEATVTAAVEEQFLDGKVLIFKKRRRKNSRRLNGHRQPLTALRILDIHGIKESSSTSSNDT